MTPFSKKESNRNSVRVEKKELMNFLDERGVDWKKKPKLNEEAERSIPKLKDRLNRQLLKKTPDLIVKHKILNLAREKNRDKQGEPRYKYKQFENVIEQLLLLETTPDTNSKATPRAGIATTSRKSDASGVAGQTYQT